MTDQIAEYERAHSDLIALTTPTIGYPAYITSSPEAADYISSRPNIFPKPTSLWRYQAINIYGKNIVTVSGDEWRRHRAVVRGSFSESVMEKGWIEMIVAYHKMLKGEALTGGGIVNDLPGAITKVGLWGGTPGSEASLIQWHR